jgi:hypothetical protein
VVTLNERLREIERIDRDIAAMGPTNVVPMNHKSHATELHRQRAAHVSAIRAGAER